MIHYRRLLWYFLHDGRWVGRGVEELTYNEMILARHSHLGEL